MTCNVRKGISLSFCFELSIRASFLIRTGDRNIQMGEIICKNYIHFDDLKILGKTDEVDTDEEEFGEDTSKFSYNYAFFFFVSNH